MGAHKQGYSNSQHSANTAILGQAGGERAGIDLYRLDLTVSKAMLKRLPTKIGALLESIVDSTPMSGVRSDNYNKFINF